MLSRRSRIARTLGLASALASAPLAPACLAQFPARDAFSREPKTALESWEVADYLIRIGQPAQAAPYVKRFLDSKPDDATLLTVRDTYGAGSILRLSDDPATRPYATPLADLLAKAAARNATDPARIERFIGALTKSREEQDYAVERLREAGPYADPADRPELSKAGPRPIDPDAAIGQPRPARPQGRPRPDRIARQPDDPKLVADVATALGKIGDARAIPPLTYLAARKPTPSRPRGSRPARRSGASPADRSSRSTGPPSKVLADEARRYQAHAVPFPGDRVILWLWDEAAGLPEPKPISSRDAEGLLGLRAAREALTIDPTDPEAQAVLVGPGPRPRPGRLGRRRASRPAPTSSAGSSAEGDRRRPARPRGLGRPAARPGRRPGRPDRRRPNPLVDALAVARPPGPVRRRRGDRRSSNPGRPFPGSSRLVPMLARFVAGQGAPGPS